MSHACLCSEKNMREIIIILMTIHLHCETFKNKQTNKFYILGQEKTFNLLDCTAEKLTNGNDTNGRPFGANGFLTSEKLLNKT